MEQIQREYYDSFILQKISQNSLTDIQYSFLTSVEGTHNLAEALQQLNLRQEFNSFQNQKIKELQDSKLQDTILFDRIKPFKTIQTNHRTRISELMSKIVPLEVEFKCWNDRHLLYPENPKFQANVAVFEKQLRECKDEIALLQHEIDKAEQQIQQISDTMKIPT